MQIKTIDIIGKEWDRRSGGRYQSAQVTINYGLPDSRTYYCPMQWGGVYEQSAAEKLWKVGVLPGKQIALWQFCRENGVILRSTLHEGCTEKEVREWGTHPGMEYNYCSPDGHHISAENFPTKEAAKKALNKWLRGFKKQGYYLTSSHEKIELDHLRYWCHLAEIEPIEDESELPEPKPF